MAHTRPNGVLRETLINQMSLAGRMYIGNSGPAETGLAFTLVITVPSLADIKVVIPSFTAFSETSSFFYVTPDPTNLLLLPGSTLPEIPTAHGQPPPVAQTTGGISAVLPLNAATQLALGVEPNVRKVYTDLPMFEVGPGHSIALTLDPNGNSRISMSASWWEAGLSA